MKRRRKKCRNCGRLFIPNRFNHHHQTYCSNPECRRVGKRASDRKYRKKQSVKLDFRLKESHRVQVYQKKNPTYWKNRKKDSKKSSEKELLHDFAQVEKLQNDIAVLRDIAIWQGTAFKGLVSYITDEVLRDDIGVSCNRLYDRGKEVSGMGPEILFNIKSTEFHNETQRTNRT